MTFFFFSKTFVLGLGPLSDQTAPRLLASPVQGRQSKDASPTVHMDPNETHGHSDECIVRAIYQTTYDYDVVYHSTQEGVRKPFKREAIPSHFRSMTIVRHMWKKLSREQMEKQVLWAIESCRTIGVQQGKYLATVVCSAKVWLLRTYNRILESFPWNPKAREVPSLEVVCNELMETLLAVKNAWYNESRKLATAFPEAVATEPIPIGRYRPDMKLGLIL